MGSRTTHYTFSTNTLMNSMRSYARLGYRGPPVSEVSTEAAGPSHGAGGLTLSSSSHRKRATSSCPTTTATTC